MEHNDNRTLRRSRMLAIVAVAVAAVMAAGLQGCADSTQSRTSGRIDEAREALADNAFNRAVEICNKVVTSSDTSSLSARQYFNLATIYAVVADNDMDNGGNMAQAARCLSRARTMAPDSVAGYMSELPVDRQLALSTVEMLLVNHGADMSGFVDPEDPSLLEDHDIDPDNTEAHEH